jgi:hypothetical protein
LETVRLYLKPGLGPERSVEAYDDTSAKYDKVSGRVVIGLIIPAVGRCGYEIKDPL